MNNLGVGTFDGKLKQSATSKKKEKKSKKKTKTTESSSKKSTSKDDGEEKERRRRKRRAKAEKVRASLKSVDSDQSKEIHRSSPSRLTIDEDKEGVSEILCSDSKHRPRLSMPQESGDAVSLRHISDLTIDDEDDEPVNSMNDVGWDDLDGALLSAQQMSMKVASDDAHKIQNEVESWDDGFDEEAIAKAQNMSMKVAASDATKLQAQLLADSGGGRENQGPIVAERKARGRRGGEKKKGKDNDIPRQPQLEQAQLILAAKVDKLLPIVGEYGKTKLDVLNALQQTKYDEEKALALLLGL